MSENKGLAPVEEGKYVKAFNAGYILEKENPHLLDTLLSSKGNDDKILFKGLSAGRDEQKLEKYQTQSKVLDKRLTESSNQKQSKTASEKMDAQRASREEKARSATKENTKGKGKDR